MNDFGKRWGDEWEAESPNERHANANQEPAPVGDRSVPEVLPRTRTESEKSMDEERELRRQDFAGFREEPATTRPASHWVAVGAGVLALALLISLGYDWHERNAAQSLTRDLTSQQQDMSAALNQARARIDALTAKVNSLSTPPAPATTAPSASAMGENKPARRPRVVQDRRWKKMQDQLAAQQKEIDTTTQNLNTTQQNLDQARTELANNLNSAKDELGGSIAKTHDELVALEKKGERNYYEFDLTKSKQFKHVGSLSLSLRKTNTKHGYFDVSMIVDDFTLDKKHVNLYEPVLIYPSDSRQPLELVANRIDKDGVHGYISEPKYGETASASTGINGGVPSGSTANSAPANAGTQGNSGSAPADKTDASLPHRAEPNK